MVKSIEHSLRKKATQGISSGALTEKAELGVTIPFPPIISYLCYMFSTTTLLSQLFLTDEIRKAA